MERLIVNALYVFYMVLRCKCGGALELVSSADMGKNRWTEKYQCVSCGKTGRFTVDGENQSTSGCVKIV